MRLLILSLLFTSYLGTADLIPIKRNQHWNEFVLEIQAQQLPLENVQKFLKAHEQELKLEILDYQVLVNLDKAIKSNEKKTKNLKKLKKKLPYVRNQPKKTTPQKKEKKKKIRMGGNRRKREPGRLFWFFSRWI